MSLRVAADIGGTFTDIAIEDGARRWSVKVPTTHDAPERGVLEGVGKGLAEAGRTLSDVSLVVHGTTLATNALIERKGARTGLLTTEGFRDVLEMGNEGRFDQYDIRAMKPAPLIPRHLRYTVRERLRHDGSVVEPLDKRGLVAAAARMRDAGVEAVAVTFLHAYADGSHEARARDLLRQELDIAHYSLSHEVSPQMREYERVSTTCANAYLVRLEQRLKADGLGGPLLMIFSSGSLTTMETASRFPIRLLEVRSGRGRHLRLRHCPPASFRKRAVVRRGRHDSEVLPSGPRRRPALQVFRGGADLPFQERQRPTRYGAGY